jgi:predicted HTH transcriptional regulator
VQLEKQFDAKRSREAAVELVAREETLPALFPQARTEVVERRGDRTTLRAYYRALGREGTATFHFDFLPDGDVRFEKVCDGRVWRELQGAVSFEKRGRGTRVRIELNGRTKTLVPELAIRGAMQEQMDEMALALREILET